MEPAASVSKHTPTRVQEARTHTDQHQNRIYFWSIIDVGSLGRVKAFPQGSCATGLNHSIARLKAINTLKCLLKSPNRP